MHIHEISPTTIDGLDDQEILALHRRVHQLWGKHFADNTQETTNGLTREDLVNAHKFLVREMQRRAMRHRSPLVTKAQLATDHIGTITVVPNFVSIAGSIAETGGGDDVDVVLRTEDDGKGHALIWLDNLHLPLRKVLDPDKEGFLHYIHNPQGPHAAHLPLYDLCLVPSHASAQFQQRPGLYLVEPHGEMIWRGEKKAIVKSRRFEIEGEYAWVSGNKVYGLIQLDDSREIDLKGEFALVSGNKVYGLIRLDDPREIDLEEFAQLEMAHRVTQGERKEWWPHKQTLYYYPIASFQKFARPRIIDVPQGVQTFIESVQLADISPNGDHVKIDLGCGTVKPDGYIGVDIRPYPGVDILHDLRQGLPFPDNYAHLIRAHHFLEHMPDPVFTMYEIWRVLRPGGILKFEVPSTSGEGAFAHPGHESYWNKSSFHFYCHPQLAEEIGFLGQFEIYVVAERRHSYKDLVYVFGSLIAIKPTKETTLAVSGWYTGPMPKPAMKVHTEFFSVEELWEKWAARRIERGIAVEEKLNGLRAIVQKRGEQVRIRFPSGNVQSRFPDLVQDLKDTEGDFALDCNVGVEQDGKPWPRIKLMELMKDKPDLPAGAQVVATAFDVLQDSQPIHTDDGQSSAPIDEWKLVQRREQLTWRVKHIDSKHIAASAAKFVGTKAELEKAAQEMAGRPGSEGVVAKVLDSPYPLGQKGTSDWAKVKSVVEIKAIVLETKRGKGGAHNFRGGVLSGDTDIPNRKEFEGTEYVDLGYSFNAPFEAKPGDIVTFEVEEIILQENGELAWLGAKPIDVDQGRKRPYQARQTVNLARRGHVLQDATTGASNLASAKDERGGAARARSSSSVDLLESQDRLAQSRDDEEGGTRSAAARKFWGDHWHESFPKSGKGEFVYQRHWRGLSEEQAEMDEDQLLETDHSVHGDLRMAFNGALHGWSIFLGQASDVAGGRTLATLPHDDAFQVAPKLHQPKEWLTIARRAPFVSEPGGVGSTSKSWSKFFEVDHGTYQIGVWREHSFEYFLEGDQVTGRYIVAYVPVANAKQASPGHWIGEVTIAGEVCRAHLAENKRRVWLIRRIESQEPYADTHEQEKVVDELKEKRQRWLVWAKPDSKPELIDVREG